MNYLDYMERVIDRQMQSDQHQWIYSQIEKIKKPKKPHRKPPRKDYMHYKCKEDVKEKVKHNRIKRNGARTIEEIEYMLKGLK